ncbi:serine/threonine protein kinase [Calothrix sp. 336/3]|uniref:serine/threonine protein kinase n=1 Tax=Calothrix sp. 336/3 TaxID=1337936 RepID=UPI0004E359A1|nr:serine/threonine-protein kinase [Calothrix sp. 336/3]AKG24854.1 protein kinase [Calothrix sp. 336/3]
MLQNEVTRDFIPKTELDIYIGKFLNNRYLIRDLVGKGGMGRVYLAEDAAKGGMPVAIKILNMNLDDQQTSQRFAREIFIGAQLGRKNQHIIRVLSYGITEDKIPFYVMEYLQGKTLKTILKFHTLSISEFLNYCQQICVGLQCAHQGVNLKGETYPIIHRDIKPENIFIIDDNKQGEIVKILDFGIAKFLSERSGMTLTESFIGSLPYCSPEHMEGRKLLDVRSDIYSLGVLMYEMLAGKHPFHMKSKSFGDWYQAHRFEAPPQLDKVVSKVKIPQELQNLVMGCLAKDVNARPSSINEILLTLEKVKQQVNKTLPDTDNSDNYLSLQLVPVTTISEQVCLQKTWPKNKPIAPICFPHLLHTQQGNSATLWAMLPLKEIEKLSEKINCTEFVFEKDLYPAILWITVLSDIKLQLTRWLSYCLDLKDSRGQRIVKVLAETGYYHLLFFAIEEPNKCRQVLTLSLNTQQRQQLLDWLDSSHKNNVMLSLHDSKNMLKAKYEKLKPEIIHYLTNQQQPNPHKVKSWLGKIVRRFLQKFSY